VWTSYQFGWALCIGVDVSITIVKSHNTLVSGG
jgi:hypothetical protein